MTKDNSSSDKSKGGKKKAIKLVALGVVLVTLFLAFFLPYTVSNGVEKFSGKEAKLAKQVLGDGSYRGVNASPIPNLAIAFRAKIKNVYKQSPEKKCAIKNTTEGVTYVVEISRITFFGIEKPGYDQPLCITD